MADWEAITSGWVERGLVQPEHRAALLDELTQLEAARRPSELSLGPVVTLLVTGAIWLLTGAMVTAMVLLGLNDPRGFFVSAVVGAAGGLSLVLGGSMRSSRSVLPLSRGLLAAAPPLLSMALVIVLESMRAQLSGLPLLLIAHLAVLPGLVCLVGAWIEGSRSWASTSALAAACAAMAALSIAPRQSGFALVGALAALLVVAGLSGLSRLRPERAMVFQVAVPSVLLYLALATALSATLLGPLWSTLGVRSPWEVEKSLQLLVQAVALVGLGAWSRQAFTLVPAILLVGLATVSLAGAVGSWIGGTLALGAMGGLFLAGASVLWVLGLGRRTIARPDR